MTTAATMAVAAPAGGALPPVPGDNLANMNRYKLKPPFYNGDYSTFEEWKYKFTAYMGLQDNDYTALLQAAEAANPELTEAQLRGAATTIEDGERHVRLSTDLRYILINTTSGPAATLCRQFQHTLGFEMYRQLCIRFSIPLGTRSIGHLTRLLKPKFDNNNFEKSFSTWEFELQRFERDNGQQLPDAVKIAVLLNETTGPLKQHLQLLSGQNPTYARVKQTIIEYYRSTTAFSKLQQLATQSSRVSTNYAGGQAPMDIDAIRKGKGKHNNKGKGKSKGKHKGKGYGGYNRYGYNYPKGKGKYGGKGYNNYNPIGYGNPFGKGSKGIKGENKGYNKGKGRNKGKQVTDTCYRCGRAGHYAKDCRVAIRNIGQGEHNDNEDTTAQWYTDYYDNGWYHIDYTQQQPQQQYYTQQQPQQQLALPPIPPTAGNNGSMPIHVIAMIGNGNSNNNQMTTTDTTNIMIDSGAATHVCPLWFADNYPIHRFDEAQLPNLRTVTNKTIQCYGVRWVYMQSRGQPIVIPFYVCDIHDPILSVTRLAEQCFDIRFNDAPTMSHNKGFNVPLVQQHNLYYLPQVRKQYNGWPTTRVWVTPWHVIRQWSWQSALTPTI